MGCDSKRYNKFIKAWYWVEGANLRRKLLTDERGQSTVEYAVVLGALLCIVMAVGALGNAVSGGTFIRHGVMAASHCLQGSVGGIVDVFCY